MRIKILCNFVHSANPIVLIIIAQAACYLPLFILGSFCYSYKAYADVVELVDTHALGACAFGREGSSPFIRTKEIADQYDRLFLLPNSSHI